MKTYFIVFVYSIHTRYWLHQYLCCFDCLKLTYSEKILNDLCKMWDGNFVPRGSTWMIDPNVRNILQWAEISPSGRPMPCALCSATRCHCRARGSRVESPPEPCAGQQRQRLTGNAWRQFHKVFTGSRPCQEKPDSLVNKKETKKL